MLFRNLSAMVRSQIARPRPGGGNGKNARDLAKEAAIIDPLFDREWYLLQNPDVARAAIDPVEHYLMHGSKEGRWPNAVFDPLWYRQHHDELAQWQQDSLTHFTLHGRHQGKWPSSAFDPSCYLAANPDVAEAQIEATEHYSRHGRREGRPLNPTVAAHVPATTPVQASSPSVTRQALTPKLVGADETREVFGPLQSWQLRSAQNEPATAMTQRLERALKDSRLDAGKRRTSSKADVSVVVATSAADVSAEKSNILIGCLLEEDGTLLDCVASANANSEGVVCASTYMRDRLVDNGLAIPSAAIGIGVDDWDQVVASSVYNTSEDGGFRFLHVLPDRIGDDTDALLQCYGNVFDASDNVSLVVVASTENAAGTIRDCLHRHRVKDPHFPALLLVQGPLQEADLKSLYLSCHVYISRTDTQRFNLPVARGLLCGLPPIIVGYGGHMDYCSSENSWLLDFECVPPKSPTFGTSFSLKVKQASLEAALWDGYVSGPSQRSWKAWSGRRTLLSTYTWKDVALRLATFARRQNRPRLPVGWVTTWNVQCGIGSYAEHMLSSRAMEDFVVFAARQEPRTRSDEPNVVRTWEPSKAINNLHAVESAFALRPCDSVIIQFNYGFFNHHELGNFINVLLTKGVVVFLDVHSTIDHGVPNFQLVDMKETLEKIARIIVHNASDWARMKQMGLLRNTLYSPLGLLSHRPPSKTKQDRAVPIITSFGFCFLGKGLVELVHAVALLKDRGTRVHLRMLNAEYPAPHSREAVVLIEEVIRKLKIEDCVDFRKEFLDDETALGLIADADLFINPYQYTNESASGATRYGMAAKVPVVVTPLPIFDDFKDAVFRMSGTSPADIAQGIEDTLNAVTKKTPLAQKTSLEAETWRLAHDCDTLGERLERAARALVSSHLSIGVVSPAERGKRLPTDQKAES